MNPTPSSAALAYSAGIPAKSTGRLAPAAISTQPASIGLRAPTRSQKRPAGTASSIGSTA